ncbi:uncharacterized protein LOC111307006 [Durio zibethinus]|uniref:Uncharacterized protein LOC111307006 n=1 Tax=Durio zibethinus TaxID=66656 RepID=A0A6P6A7U1_DURZI|nr:uncharacterized protein LOC111307006 [Durio zibethinus]
MACYQSLNLQAHSLWRNLHCFRRNFSRTLRVRNNLSSFKKFYVVRPSPFQTIKGYCSLSTLPVAIHAAPHANAVIPTKREQILDQEAALGRANLQETAANANFSNGRVMLIDGTSVIYRAYYKLLAKLHHGYLSHADGNGDWVLTIFTALSLIIDVLEFVPSHVAVVFDHDGIPFGHTSISSKDNVMAKGLNFRHTLYPSYKSNRPPTPDTIVQGLQYLKASVKAMSIKVIEVPGVEADDVIGTLAARSVDAGFKVIILSFFGKTAMLRCDLPFYMVPFATGDLTFKKPEDNGEKFTSLLNAISAYAEGFSADPIIRRAFYLWKKLEAH